MLGPHYQAAFAVAGAAGMVSPVSPVIEFGLSDRRTPRHDLVGTAPWIFEVAPVAFSGLSPSCGLAPLAAMARVAAPPALPNPRGDMPLTPGSPVSQPAASSCPASPRMISGAHSAPCATACARPTSGCSSLGRTIARFTATSSPINEIRAGHLAAELRERIARLPFVKGPYIEILPDFEKGGSLAEAALHPDWRQFGAAAPGVWKRPLHAHQQKALLRSENFLVVTGTGSVRTAVRN